MDRFLHEIAASRCKPAPIKPLSCELHFLHFLHHFRLVVIFLPLTAMLVETQVEEEVTKIM